MMLLAFHIIFITLLIMVVGNIGYKMGQREGEKRTRRKLEAEGLLRSESELAEKS